MQTELELPSGHAMVVHCKPGPWGNPYSIGQHGTREQVIALYEAWLFEQPDLVARAQAELRGKVLGCWCKPQRCHGDVLARIASVGEAV